MKSIWQVTIIEKMKVRFFESAKFWQIVDQMATVSMEFNDGRQNVNERKYWQCQNVIAMV
jgi:hypothetical protein